jgi:hypothetical protein
MITLPSHTSYVLEPLDVSCFKPFKTTFRKERDNNMVSSNYKGQDKIVLANWVDKVLDATLSKRNINNRFKVTWI